MHAHNYPIDQVKEVALTTIEALNRVDSTASDADFNDGNFARLDAVRDKPRPSGRGGCQLWLSRGSNGTVVLAHQNIVRLAPI